MYYYGIHAIPKKFIRPMLLCTMYKIMYVVCTSIYCFSFKFSLPQLFFK